MSDTSKKQPSTLELIVIKNGDNTYTLYVNGTESAVVRSLAELTNKTVYQIYNELGV